MEISKELNDWLNTNIPDNGHHILSPSGYSGWAKCTGGMNGLGEARASNQDNIASVEGTLGHYLLEICITLWISPLVLDYTPDCFLIDAKKWVDKILNNNNNTEEVRFFAEQCYDELATCTFTQEMREEIEKCYQRILVYKNDGWTILPEGKVSLESYFGHKHCDGTSDIIMYKGNRLIIVDLKYGKGIEVEPLNSGQLQLYCGGACAYLWSLGISVDRITLVIMQPRINNGYWKAWETNYSNLYAFLMEAKDLSITALNVLSGTGEATYKPSVSSCMWCHRRKGDNACTKRMEFALTSVQDMFAEAEIVEGDPITTDGISNETLADIVLRTPYITAFLRDMADEAHSRAKKGQAIPGNKIVKGRSARSWKEKVDNVLVSTFVKAGIQPQECFNIALKSPAQMGKVKLDKEQKKVVKEATHFSYGSNILVPNSDKREAVLTVADKFESAGF